MNNSCVAGLYDVPAGIIALLSVFYGTISVLAVVGNSLVMWIVATSRRMQNVTNCFISNLALADIVIGLFAIPFQVNEDFQLHSLYVQLHFFTASYEVWQKNNETVFFINLNEGLNVSTQYGRGEETWKWREKKTQE